MHAANKHAQVHPAAQVHASAQLHPSVQVGPYATVESGVIVGEGSFIAAHAKVHAGTQIGKRVLLDHFSIVGAVPQSSGLSTGRLIIEDDVKIREGALVERCAEASGETRIGAGSYIMACAKVRSGVLLGVRVCVTNTVELAENVHLEDHVIVGGGTRIRAGVRVGTRAMIGSHATITLHVPPFTLSSDCDRLCGFNAIGLKRNGFSLETMIDLRACYRAVYRSSGDYSQRARTALEEPIFKTSAGERFLRFFTESEEGTFIEPKTIGS